VDQHAIDAMRHDTPEPRPGLCELNEQWAARVGQQQSEQSRRDDSARHAAIISTAECLVRIKYRWVCSCSAHCSSSSGKGGN
jgi:hypothetical protein